MHRQTPSIVVATMAALLVLASGAAAAAANDAAVIAQATGGKFQATSGPYKDGDCPSPEAYDAKVEDLNGDGQPEVWLNLSGPCIGGRVGSVMDLYVKNKQGRWQAQFGFPGVPLVQTTKHLGFPDVLVGGPGTCAPVWRWNGRKYDLFKRCR